MSEQITGEQLESNAGQWKSIPVHCEECDWEGDVEDLVCKIVRGLLWSVGAVAYVCPECGSDQIEGDD